MIPGLHSAAISGLAVPADLSGARIGVDANAVADWPQSELRDVLRNYHSSLLLVFDGPGRTTPSPLGEGLRRRELIRLLAECNTPFLVCPALASAQLAYLCERRFVSVVAGADEALLFADVPLLVDLRKALKNMDKALVLRRGAVLSHLNIPENSFLEAVLGAGGNAVVAETFKPGEKNPLEEACRFAYMYGGPPPPLLPPPPGSTVPTAQPGPVVSFFRACALSPGNHRSRVDGLSRALVYVQRHPILNESGVPQLFNLSRQPVPQNLVDVIGRHLAPETLWYLNKGLLSPDLLRGMVFGRLHDVTNDEEIEYTKKLLPQRQQAYFLLVSSAHRYFQVKNVASNCGELVRTSPVTPPLPSENTAEAVVLSAIKHARAVAVPSSSSENPLELETSLAKNIGGPNPSKCAIECARLCLRQLAEVAAQWLMVTGKADRGHVQAVVTKLPWA